LLTPSVGDGGIGGTVGLGTNESVPWLIGKLVGIVPVARPYAQATAAIDGATPSSPAPPGCSEVLGITMICSCGGVFHCRV
jgi:hypothetical protein